MTKKILKAFLKRTNLYYPILRMRERYKSHQFKNRSKKFEKPLFKTIYLEKNINYELLIDPENGDVDCRLFVYGIYERPIVNCILSNLNPNDIFLDVGANIGYYTNMCAKILSIGEGKVIGFEPIKRIYEQNLRSLKRNQFKNVTLHNLACGTSTETKKIFINSKNVGASSLYSKRHELSKMKTFEDVEIIKVVKLDTKLKGQKISFIKIDVEGLEYDVIFGAKELIKENRPKIIFEFTPFIYENIRKGLSNQLLTLVTSLGYNLYNINDNMEMINNPNDYLVYMENHKIPQINLFCVHKNSNQ